MGIGLGEWTAIYFREKNKPIENQSEINYILFLTNFWKVMVLIIFLIIGGFVLLIKSADWLVDGASALALRFSVSQIVIGLTVVSFGTSTPELVVNVLAALDGMSDMSYGNIVGSNIANILLILGVSGLIVPLSTSRNTVWREIPFAFFAAIFLLVMSNDAMFDRSPSVLSRGDALVFLSMFILFLLYNFWMSKVDSNDEPQINPRSLWKIWVLILIGLLGLVIGGRMVVEGATRFAKVLGWSDKVIGLTIVAIGTSLPELFTSAMAAWRGKIDIAIGNVIGSNIFNIYFILATTALVTPLPFSNTLTFDMFFLILVSFFLFLTMFTGKRRTLDRWEAALFVGLYIAYMVYTIMVPGGAA